MIKNRRNILIGLYLVLILFKVQVAYSQKDTVFWFAAPDLSSVPGGAYDRPTYFKFSSFEQAVTITLSIPSNPSFSPIIINLNPNSHHSLNMNPYIDLIESKPANSIVNKGIKISSTKPITCYYEAAGQSTANPDIFTLKGKNALGNEFHIPFQNYLNNCSSTNGCANSSFDIIATEDATVIEITPKNALIGRPANQAFSITLNKGQVYSATALSRLASGHLGGSIVTSNKPIAITIKDDLANNIPISHCQDLIGDQMIPTTHLGKEYILVKGDLSFKDRVFICAPSINTNIYRDGILIGTISPGQMLADSFATASTYITSDKPICVLHVTGFGCESGGAILPSIHCTGTQNVVLSRSTAEPFSLIFITKTGSESGFRLNGNTTLIPPSAFATVPNTSGNWKFAKISYSIPSVGLGAHVRVTNDIGLFHLAVINGQSSGTGCRYGYFSDFNQVALDWAQTNNSPHNHFCYGDSIILTVASIEGASYSWIGPNGLVENTQNIAIPNANSSNSGEYIVTANVGNCATDFIELNVVVDTAYVHLPTYLVTNYNQEIQVHATGQFSSIVWDNATTLNPLSISPTISRWWYVYAYSEYGCFATDSVFIKVNDAPIITRFPDNNHICEGVDANADIEFRHALPNCSNIAEYRTKDLSNNWSNWLSYIPNSPIPTVGLSMIELRAYQLSCNSFGLIVNSDTASVFWHIYPQLDRQSFIREPFEDGICLSVPIALTDSANPNMPVTIEYQYQAPTQTGWSNGNSFTPDQMGMAWIRTRVVSQGFGCNNMDWEWFAWLVQPQPEIIIPNNYSICTGNSVDLSAMVVDGYGSNSYQWLVSNNNCNGVWNEIPNDTNAVLTTPVFSNASLNYYQLRVEQSGFNCFDTSSCITIQVFNQPTIALSSDTSVCYGTSGFFTAIASGGSGQNTFHWFTKTQNSDWSLITSTQINTLLIPNIQNSFELKVQLNQSDFGCTAESNSILVDVIPDVIFTSHPQNQAACVGQQITFEAEATASSVISYQWFGPNGLISGATNNVFSLQNISFSDSGIYYCKASTLCGEATSQSANLTVRGNLIPADTIYGIRSRCNGYSLDAYVASPQSESNYFWLVFPVEAGNINSLTGIMQWNSNFVGQATIQYVTMACGLVDTLSTNVEVFSPVVPPSAILGDSVRCQGWGLAQYQANSNHAFSYIWQIVNAGNSSINNDGLVYWDPNFSGQALITVRSVGCNGTSSPYSQLVTVISHPPLMSAGSVEICLGESASFHAVLDTVTGLSYQWYGPNGLINGENDSILHVQNADTSDAGVYYCIVTTYCGFSFTRFDTLILHNKPIPSFIVAPNCMSQIISFANTSTSDDMPISAFWDFGNGHTSSVYHPQQQFDTHGNFEIKLIVQSSFGCIDSTTQTLEIFEKPIFNIITENVSCHGLSDASITIDVTTGNAPFSYIINHGTAQDTNYFGGLNSGIYYITVYDDNMCFNSDSVMITQPHPLTSNYTFSNVLCHNDSSGVILPNVIGGTPPYSFLWSNGQTDSIVNVPTGTYGVSITDANGCTTNHSGIYIWQPNPLVIDTLVKQRSCELVNDGLIAVYPSGGYGNYQFLWSNSSTNDTIMDLGSGNYIVTVSDANNCQYIRQFEILPNSAQCWEIWTSFSPNADGINDEWNIRFSHLYPKMSVQVFNRWGALVYESIGEYKPWDGKGPGGHLIPPATYYFVIDLKDGVTSRITGNVTVIY